MTYQSEKHLTRRQRQILQLMREGYEIRARASATHAGSGTACIEGLYGARRISWATVQRLVAAGVIAPRLYIAATREKWYGLTEQVEQPYVECKDG